WVCIATCGNQGLAERELEAQLARIPLCTRRPRFQKGDRLRELSDRLLVRRPQLRLALDPLGKLLPEHVEDPPVELLARALEQRLVRRLLHERVLERVRRLRRLAALEHDLRVDETR